MVPSKIVCSNNASPSTSSLPSGWIKAGSHVGTSLLDDFVFGTAKQGGTGIAARVLSNLATGGAETPGFVLYPLTSFGMKMPRLFQSDPALKDFIACSGTQSLSRCYHHASNDEPLEQFDLSCCASSGPPQTLAFPLRPTALVPVRLDRS